MFNREFDLPVILTHHSEFLEEYLAEFKKLTASREVEFEGVDYIHAIDLVQDRTSETARLNKKFVNLPEGAKLAILKCPKCKHKCRLFQTHAGFLVYLFLRAAQREDSDNESVEADLEDPLSPQSASDPEEELDLQKEKEMAKDLTLSVIRTAPTSVSVPASSQRATSLPLPVLPTYPLSGGQYLLLSDIQKSLDLREDEALAILAQRWNFNVGTEEVPVKYKDFVARDRVLGKLDECFDQGLALQLCFQEVQACKEPTEDEFDEARERLTQDIAEREKLKAELTQRETPDQPIEKENKEPIVEEPQSSRRTVSSIDIWHEKTLVPDENFTVSLQQLSVNSLFQKVKNIALNFYLFFCRPRQPQMIFCEGQDEFLVQQKMLPSSTTLDNWPIHT